MQRFFLLLPLFCCFLACNDDDGPGITPPMKTPPTVSGIEYVESGANPAEVFNNLRNQVALDPANEFIVEIDHGQNATDIGRELRPTLSLHFHNAELETSILQENQLAALDLPLKVAFYQSITSESYFLYNSTNYLAARYGLTSSLIPLAVALEDIVVGAANDDATISISSQVSLDQGILSVVSNQNFADTYSDLISAINSETDMEIRAEWDFEASADAINENLNPTKLVLMGNPNWDFPMLQDNQNLSVDLPFSILVWEDASAVVRVSYNQPNYLANRHGIALNLEEVGLMTSALFRIAAAAAGN